MNSPFFRFACFAFASVLLLSSLPTPAQADDAERIMEILRVRQTRQKQDLTGYLRKGKEKIPFRLLLAGPVIRYEFKDPARTLQLRMGDKKAVLEEVNADGSAKTVSLSAAKESLFDTDLTLEDLGLQFIYWPNPEILRTEKKLKRPTWVIRLKSPTPQSQYSYVDLWVDKANGAFLQITGYDRQGKPAKDFVINQIQPVDGEWFLKEMRVMKKPENSLTYLMIDKPQ